MKEDLFLYIVVFAFAFLIMVFVTRWVFRIDTIIDTMHRQTRLLAKMAKYNNVPEREVRDVLGLEQDPEPVSAASAEFEEQIAQIIKENGTIPAISRVQQVTGVAPGAARTYVTELIEKKNLTPKNV